MISVLLVDDHAVVTEGLAVLLGGFDDLDIVGTAGGGAAAVERYDELRPDVVLMDLSMPDVDGVAATRRIVEIDADARIIALTAFIEEDLVTDALESGASGYLLKNASGAELQRCDPLGRRRRLDPERRSTRQAHIAAPGASPRHRSHPTRARRARPRRAGPEQQADRSRARPPARHDQDPRQQHPRQARGREPNRGGAHRPNHRSDGPVALIRRRDRPARRPAAPGRSARSRLRCSRRRHLELLPTPSSALLRATVRATP